MSVRDTVEVALNVPLRVGGRERAIRMTLATAGDVIPETRAPGQRSADDLPYLVLGLVDTIDGDTPGLAEAREICADADAFRTLLGARNRLWNDLRMSGRLLALCPGCDRRESSFELSTLALVLAEPPLPLFSPDGVFLQLPALAQPRRAGRRDPRLPAAARLRVLLPSGLLDLPPRAMDAVLRDLDTPRGEELEEEAWARWAPAGVDAPDERPHWRRGSLAFRSILRMSVALASVDGAEDVTPERVEHLALADFLCLDAAYYLTHNVDQPRPDALVITCEDCGGSYLPLATAADPPQ